MDEYISREAAVKAAQDGADEWGGDFNRNRDTYIEVAIDKVPTADVRPVKRGRWVKRPPFSESECSNCGKPPKLLFGMLPDYCPWCGADMID